jgi:ribosome-binding protein aMBF1 (putative translation factor)
MVEHIGEQIKSELEKKGLSVSEFAKRINKSRENCYSIFSRKTIDTGLLLKISTVLEFDFFEQFSKNAENSKKQLELMREEIQMLKDYNALLKSNGTKD